MTQEKKGFKIRFQDISLAEAGVKAADLRDEVLDCSPDVEAHIEKDDPSNMDLGGTLVLVLGTPAAVAVAKGIANYLSRVKTKVVIETDNGNVIAEGVSGKDVARITEALSKGR